MQRIFNFWDWKDDQLLSPDWTVYSIIIIKSSFLSVVEKYLILPFSIYSVIIFNCRNRDAFSTYKKNIINF